MENISFQLTYIFIKWLILINHFLLDLFSFFIGPHCETKTFWIPSTFFASSETCHKCHYLSNTYHEYV